MTSRLAAMFKGGWSREIKKASMPVSLEDLLWQPLIAFLCLFIFYGRYCVHELLSLAPGHKQLNVIPSGKVGRVPPILWSICWACLLFLCSHSLLSNFPSLLYYHLYVHLLASFSAIVSSYRNSFLYNKSRIQWVQVIPVVFFHPSLTGKALGLGLRGESCGISHGALH